MAEEINEHGDFVIFKKRYCTETNMMLNKKITLINKKNDIHELIEEWYTDIDLESEEYIYHDNMTNLGSDIETDDD